MGSSLSQEDDTSKSPIKGSSRGLTVLGIIAILLLLGAGIAIVVSSKKSNKNNCNTLSAPTGVTAVSPSPGTISLSWNSTTSATSYNVYRSTSSSISITNYQQKISTLIPSGSFSQLTSASQYFLVTSINSCGESQPSTVVNIQMNCTLGQVQNVQLSSVSNNGILASWDAVPLATSYSIFYIVNDDVEKQDTVLAPNTTYSFTGSGAITFAVNAVNICSTGTIGFASANLPDND